MTIQALKFALIGINVFSMTFTHYQLGKIWEFIGAKTILCLDAVLLQIYNYIYLCFKQAGREILNSI